MPNRILKESIHESERVNRMTDFQFRVWIYLITYVDDYGRGDARPAVIKGKCFPLRERVTNKDIDSALHALADIGCVALYETDGRPYLYLPRWELHQNIRNKRSKFPAPPGAADNCAQLHAIAPVIQSESESESQSQSEYESESEPASARAARVFHPPTVEEVRKYCEKNKYGVDPESFVDYYTAVGWVVGRCSMRDWKAAVRRWEKNKNEDDAPAGKKTDDARAAPSYDIVRAESMLLGPGPVYQKRIKAKARKSGTAD